MPLLPLGALGVAAIVDWTLRRRWIAVVVAVFILLVAYSGNAARIMRDQAATERADRTAMHASFAALTAWCEKAIDPDDVVASFDYREIALRLGRAVLPLRYTSATGDQVRHLRQQGVDWLILSDSIHDLRRAYARAVVTALGPEAVLVFQLDDFAVYRIHESREGAGAGKKP